VTDDLKLRKTNIESLGTASSKKDRSSKVLRGAIETLDFAFAELWMQNPTANPKHIGRLIEDNALLQSDVLFFSRESPLLRMNLSTLPRMPLLKP